MKRSYQPEQIVRILHDVQAQLAAAQVAHDQRALLHGGSGSAVNIMGEAATLKVTGKANVAIYRPKQGLRHFCRKCGSALWVWDRRWADWIYPFASAIDTPLPMPRERQHILLDSRATWVRVPAGPREKRFRAYPREAIADWHRRRKLLSP